MSSNTKDLHQAIDAAQKRGWILVRKTSGGHYKLQWPHGGRSVFTSGTPSDWRVIHNLKSELSKIEDQFPAPPVKIQVKKKTVVQSIEELPALGTLGDFMPKEKSMKFKTRITKNDKVLRFSLPEELKDYRYEVMWDKGVLCVAKSTSKNAVAVSLTATSPNGKKYYTLGFSSKRWVPNMPDGTIVIEAEWIKDDHFIIDLNTSLFVPKMVKEKADGSQIQEEITHEVKFPKGKFVTPQVIEDVKPKEDPESKDEKPTKSPREVVKLMIDRINNFCAKNGFSPEIVDGKVRLTKSEVIG